jgi:AcrR family transcriptional regulator
MRSKVSSRDHIIEVAEEIFKQDGIEGLKVRNISLKTGIALGTIYNYFSSQEELVEEIFVLSWNKTKEKLKIIAHKPLPIDEKIHAFFNKLNDDILARKDIGDYVLTKILFVSSFENSKYNVFKDISILLESILKESNNNEAVTVEKLDISSQLALLGFLYFRRQDKTKFDSYKELIINKFA